MLRMVLVLMSKQGGSGRLITMPFLMLGSFIPMHFHTVQFLSLLSTVSMSNLRNENTVNVYVRMNMECSPP